MMNKRLQKIFKKTDKIVVGMVHFPPLLGYPGYPGFEVCLKKAIRDAKALITGGVDSIMVENNYDQPHNEFVGPGTVATMALLTKEISKLSKLPMGVTVLWNDYRAALSIADVAGANFIRVPVFVDSVRTQYGKIFADPKKVIAARKEMGLINIAIFADIHVKHAEMLEKKTIKRSAKEAMKAGADGIIITGRWTGDMPKIDDLKEVRKAVGKDFPILIGSGATKNNANLLLQYANIIIVGTSLKTGKIQNREINLKPWKEGISLQKTKEFIHSIEHPIG